jgi:hypothetical protein
VSVSALSYGSDRVANLADALMQKVIDVFAMEGVPLPERRFLTVGTPVHDCEELVVVFSSLSKGLPGQEDTSQRCDASVSVTFQIHLVRCFPLPGGRGNLAPSAESLSTNADGLMQDAWLLVKAASELVDNPFVSFGGMVNSVQAEEPQGGFSAVVGSLTMVVP